MPVRKVTVGTDRLALTTQLLQRARLADPTAGVWEAADVQWWSRMPRRSDGVAVPLWFDDDGPVAALLLTDWRDAWALDVLRVPGRAPDLDEIWAEAPGLMAAGPNTRYEALVREDDEGLIERLLAAGFEPDSQAGEAWMDAAERPPVAPPPAGYVIRDRVQSRSRPHPMIGRNGQEVEARLHRCSLYDPELDLAVQAEDGSFAGYALFWADPVTKVGLLEPMRVEDPHARRGLARGLLSEGLDRLADRGMTRLKVGFESEPARALYLGAGFRPGVALRTYARA